MDAKHDYLIVDPVTFYGINPNEKLSIRQKEMLVKEAKNRFVSLYKILPEEEPFWCFGYDVACAGPIPH